MCFSYFLLLVFSAIHKTNNKRQTTRRRRQVDCNTEAATGEGQVSGGKTGGGGSSMDAQASASCEQSTEKADGEKPSEPPPKRQKIGKVNQKRNQFKGYGDQEKASFQVTLQTTSGESRALTAIDDMIRALDYVIDWLVASKTLQEADVTSDRVMSTYGFCVSLFLEFAWTGKVCIDGKEFRQYSSLRTEIQQTLVTANEQLAAPFELDGGSGQADATDGKALNPLELAAMLCQTFLNKPVTSVIWDVTDDPEEQIVKNIAESMQKGLGQDIKEFVSSTLHLPVVMHAGPRDALQQIFSLPPKGTLNLIDLLAVVFTSICQHFPPAWCGFGFDVATAYADRHHFVEDTDKAWHA